MPRGRTTRAASEPNRTAPAGKAAEEPNLSASDGDGRNKFVVRGTSSTGDALLERNLVSSIRNTHIHTDSTPDSHMDNIRSQIRTAHRFQSLPKHPPQREALRQSRTPLPQALSKEVFSSLYLQVYDY
jgi:hypothetical protein